MRRLLSAFLVISGMSGCAAVPQADDTASQAAATAEEDDGKADGARDLSFYLGTLAAGNGMRAKILRIQPTGNPSYVLDLPNPPGSGLDGARCTVNSYYGIRSGVYSLRDDNDAMMASVANPGHALPTPDEACSSETCASDAAWLGKAPSWNYMVYGIDWVFRHDEGLRMILRPTQSIVGVLTVEAICHGATSDF